MDASNVADELAIRRTLAAYCQHCDDGMFDSLAALFSAGGTFTYLGEVVAGSAALTAWFVAAQPPARRGKHVTVNAVIDISGDRATARSDFVFLRFVNGSLVPLTAGRYVDELVRQDGRWLIERRVVEDMRPPG